MHGWELATGRDSQLRRPVSLDTYIDDPPGTEACATIEPVIVPQLIYLDSLLVVRQRYPRCHIAEPAAKRARSPPHGGSETERSSTQGFFPLQDMAGKSSLIRRGAQSASKASEHAMGGRDVSESPCCRSVMQAKRI